MRLFVVDAHPIFRRGLVTCLLALPDVESVGESTAVIAAQDDEACMTTDLLVIDGHAEEALEFVTELTASGSTHVIVVISATQPRVARRALQAGATGVLTREAMTPETLAAAVHAVTHSSNLVISAALDDLLSDERPRPQPVLTPREHRVLTLLADGASLREAAEALHYSERTVKTVVRTSVTKLNARSRSHAIAEAVRSGLI